MSIPTHVFVTFIQINHFCDFRFLLSFVAFAKNDL
jgi:hypothetical protein